MARRPSIGRSGARSTSRMPASGSVTTPTTVWRAVSPATSLSVARSRRRSRARRRREKCFTAPPGPSRRWRCRQGRPIEMRVLELLTQLHLNSQSGSPKHVLELSGALRQTGAEVILITGRGATPETRQKVDELDLRLVEFDYHDLVTFPRCFQRPSELLFGLTNAVQAVLACCDGDGPTVLHAHHMPHSPVVAELVDRCVGLPYLTTTHGSDLYE